MELFVVDFFNLPGYSEIAKVLLGQAGRFVSAGFGKFLIVDGELVLFGSVVRVELTYLPLHKQGSIEPKKVLRLHAKSL